MRLLIFFISFASIIVFLFFYYNKTALDGGIENKTRFTISNFSKKYEYLIFLNDEPIYSGSNMTYFHWQGFPIKNGTNKLKFIFKSIVNSSKDNIVTRLNTIIFDGGQENKSVSINIPLKQEKETEHTIYFNITKKSFNRYFIYDDLSNSPHLEIAKDIKKFTLYYVHLLTSRNFKSINKIFKNKNISTNYPKWFVQSEDKDLKVTAVDKEDDLKVILGKQMILVVPSNKFVKKFKVKSLYSIERVKDNTKISESCYSFAKYEDKWCIIEREGNLIPIAIQ